MKEKTKVRLSLWIRFANNAQKVKKDASDSFLPVSFSRLFEKSNDWCSMTVVGLIKIFPDRTAILSTHFKFLYFFSNGTPCSFCPLGRCTSWTRAGRVLINFLPLSSSPPPKISHIQTYNCKRENKKKKFLVFF